MKARTRKTRWLLITLLVGFLAAAGVTFLLHQHPDRLLVSAGGIVPADDTSLQQTDTTAPAAIGDDQSAQTPTPADARGDHFIAGTYSNSTQTGAAEDSNSPSTSAGGAASGAANQPADTAGSSGGTQQQTHGPSSSGDATPPQQATGGGELANNGYMPFDCGMPAGCGGAGSGIIPTSGSSGGTPSLHNSQGSGPQTDNPDPQTDNSGQPTDSSNPNDPGTGNPGQKSDPSDPGSSPPVAAAPELDPATLAGALTLLLGSLAIVRSRRIRITR